MRVVIIALVFLAAAVFGFINHLNTAKELNQIQKPAVGTATPAGAPTVDAHRAATRQDTEPAVVTIEKHPTGSHDQQPTLAEQLERQSNWLQSVAAVRVEDGGLATEVGAIPHGPPNPSRRGVPVDNRGVLLTEQYEDNTTLVRRWDPFTGEMNPVLMLKGFDISKGLVSETGLFFLVREISNAYVNVDNLVHIDKAGVATMAPLWSVRDDPHLVLLSDGSVMIVGGTDTVTERQLNTVEMATVSQGRIEVEAMRDFPGPPRWGYSVVALADGKLMILGGNTSKYQGCQHGQCTNSTFILNPKSRLWGTGPNMLYPRAAATASLLADGSVLVTGGWEADQTTNAARSDKSERFIPEKYLFERAARLPMAMAEHRAMHLTGDSSSPLLLLDTNTSSVLSYDLELESFRAVGGYSSLMSFELGPFSDGREHFFWVSGDNGRAWARHRIRIGDSSADYEVPSSRTIHLYRTASSFLMDESGHSALIVGGYVRDSSETTAAVDSYSFQTGLQALLPMPVARIGARAFRLRNGAVVVAGGASDHPEHDSWNEEARALPLQVLLDESVHSKWHSVLVDHPLNTQYAQLNRDSLVAIIDGIKAENLTFNFSDLNPPEIDKRPLPDLPVFRGSRSQPENQVVAKGLNDGRLIVAGGVMHEKRIAVIQDFPEETQRYVGRGDLVMADTYEIYDPVQNRWSSSAPSPKRGGQVAIMDDGRVVKLHQETVSSRPEEGGSLSLEISQPDGRGWKTLEAKRPPQIEAASARLITLDNELFLSGHGLAAGDGPKRRILQWFNADEPEWNTVWIEGNTEVNSRRRDVLAIVEIAGKRQLLVPVGGQ